MFYNSRNAADTGSRAARIAGKSPPTNPITSAKIVPFTSNGGVTSNAKVTWLKVSQFSVDVR